MTKAWEHLQNVLEVYLQPGSSKVDALRILAQSPDFEAWFNRNVGPQIFRHGLIGLYHDVFKSLGIQNSSLTEMYNRQVSVQMKLLQLQEIALRLIQEENIPWVLLKGLSLSERLYGNLSLRPSSDVDILIPEKYHQRCVDLFRQNGFEEVRPIAGHFHTTLNHPDLSGVVELHQGLGDRVFPFDVDAIFSRAEMGQMEVTDEILYLAYHAGRNYFVFRLVLLVDLVLAVRKWKQQIDWEKLVCRAREARVLGLVNGALACARELFVAESAELEGWRLDGLAPLSDKVRKWCLVPDPLTARVQSDVWVRRSLFWSCLDSWEDQVRFFLQRVAG